MLPSKFSLYPSFKVRALSHVFAWAFVFCFFLLTSVTLFKTGITASPVLLYSGIVFAVILFNHYFLSLFTIPAMGIKKNWPLIIIQLFFLYILSSYATTAPLGFLADRYPEYPSFKLQSEIRHFHHFSDLFTYPVFVWVLTVVFFNNVILFLIKFAKSTYESNMNNVILQQENTMLELNFLRSQIQPHFLFNTLNNIYGLVLDNRRASDSILKLSDLLRFSLYESKASHITLKRENEFLSDYINLEQMRHKERVNIKYMFSDAENSQIMIAPLLLVNYVENAFKHGVNASIGEAWVDICLEVKHNRIIFTVKNNKPDDDPPPVNGGPNEGLGLTNTQRRLELIYPEKYDLIIKETEDTFFVQLSIIVA